MTRGFHYFVLFGPEAPMHLEPTSRLHPLSLDVYQRYDATRQDKTRRNKPDPLYQLSNTVFEPIQWPIFSHSKHSWTFYLYPIHTRPSPPSPHLCFITRDFIDESGSYRAWQPWLSKRRACMFVQRFPLYICKG